jgi:imidazolonepropionase-like amidohydrolase
MTPYAKRLTLVVPLALSLAALAGRPVRAQDARATVPTGPTLVIEHATVVDVERGRRLPDRRVVVAGTRITAVDSGAAGGPRGARGARGARVVDGRGKYLIPGLVDSHVHLFWGAGATPDTLAILRWLLANGVTSIREASGTGRERELVALRERIARGETVGPRLYVSGTASMRNVARYGVHDLRELIPRLAAIGVDGIKVLHLTRAETLTALDEARRAGLPAYGHTHLAGMVQRPELPFGFTSYPLDAVRGGLSGMMHVTSATPAPDWAQEPPPPGATLEAQLAYIDAQWTRALEGWLARGEGEEQALIDTMVARGTWLEPTLVVDDIYARPERYRAHPGEASVGAAAAASWRGSPDTALVRRRSAVMPRLESFVRRFAAAGGLVLAGTDNAPLPGFGLADELALLVEAGLSPAAALRTATTSPARAFGRSDRLGAVERDRLADLVLLDADPLVDVRNVRRIDAVVANGRYLDRAALAALRAGVVPSAGSRRSHDGRGRGTSRALRAAARGRRAGHVEPPGATRQAKRPVSGGE